MTTIKNLWGKMLALFQYLGIWGKAKTMVNTFPGLENQEEVRLWVIDNADRFQPVVEKTKNKIDDRFLFEVRRVALNERAFNAIFNLMILGYEVIPKGGTDEPVYSDNEARAITAFTNAIQDEDVGNPLVFISVAGLLLQVISVIRSLRKN